MWGLDSCEVKFSSFEVQLKKKRGRSTVHSRPEIASHIQAQPRKSKQPADVVCEERRTPKQQQQQAATNDLYR